MRNSNKLIMKNLKRKPNEILLSDARKLVPSARNYFKVKFIDKNLSIPWPYFRARCETQETASFDGSSVGDRETS